MVNKIQHVVRDSNGKWAVRKEGASRATKLFITQNEAIIRGKEIARKQKAELYIHGNDGTVHEKVSYKN